MKTKRSYTMRARALAVEETRRRILQAAFDLATKLPLAQVSLESVAVEAGVSMQTVLRQFGNRNGLFSAAMDFASEAVAAERSVPTGDVDTAVRVLVDHYERRGETALLFLTQEQDPQAAPIVENAKRMHRQWVRDTFEPWTHGDDELVDLLVVATDVYAWKLLRRDRRLTRAQTERRIRRLVEAVLDQTRKADR